MLRLRLEIHQDSSSRGLGVELWDFGFQSHSVALRFAPRPMQPEQMRFQFTMRSASPAVDYPTMSCHGLQFTLMMSTNTVADRLSASFVAHDDPGVRASDEITSAF